MIYIYNKPLKRGLLCSLKSYTYTYDALNRITSGIDNTSNYNLSNVTYDKNGNIQTLTRNGWQNGSYVDMDVLDYDYDSGNKLLKVSDTGNSTYGFKDGANQPVEYTYDGNGNMLSDANKGITNISYNHLNMPTEVVFNNNPNKRIEFVYDAAGIKQRKITNDNGSITTTDYAGNQVYENGSLKQFYHAEGYVEPNGQSSYQYVYQYKDHLGNIRITYADDNSDGVVGTNEIRREQNYYPFGLEHRGYNTGSYGAKNNLKTYQGQEFNEDLGLNTHEWKYRMSDPALGRFWQVDPLAEEYTYNSTYAFQENKMGLGIELEGLEVFGLELLQDLIRRGQNIVQGSDKMTTGSSNMLNEAMSGKTGERMVVENVQSSADIEVSSTDSNFELTMEGAAQIDEALPDKQDVREAADTLELVGDTMVIGGAIATPANPAAAAATVATGGIVGTIGFGTNMFLDLSEGNFTGAFVRGLIEATSFGMGSLVRKSGGDQVVEEMTNTVLNRTGESVQKIVTEEENKK